MMDLHDKIANHKAHFDAHKNLSPHDPISFASWLQEMYNWKSYRRPFPNFMIRYFADEHTVFG